MSYNPQLAHRPFMLARHGESVFNAGTMAQGRGADKPGLPPNGLTAEGAEQVRAMHAMLQAAGIAVQHVNSSSLRRAMDSADVFIASYPGPGKKPQLGKKPIANLEEVSQKGWETIHTRQRVKHLRAAALEMLTERLRGAGLTPDLESYVGWIMKLGQGESPLEGALRGIDAIERYGVKPGELIFSHGMLNRYIGCIATRAPGKERSRLARMLKGRSEVGAVALLKSLQQLDIPNFDAADHSRNHQPNGGIVEYTVRPGNKLWAIGRTIAPTAQSSGKNNE